MVRRGPIGLGVHQLYLFRRTHTQRNGRNPIQLTSGTSPFTLPAAASVVMARAEVALKNPALLARARELEGAKELLGRA